MWPSFVADSSSSSDCVGCLRFVCELLPFGDVCWVQWNCMLKDDIVRNIRSEALRSSSCWCRSRRKGNLFPSSSNGRWLLSSVLCPFSFIEATYWVWAVNSFLFVLYLISPPQRKRNKSAEMRQNWRLWCSDVIWWLLKMRPEKVRKWRGEKRFVELICRVFQNPGPKEGYCHVWKSLKKSKEFCNKVGMLSVIKFKIQRWHGDGVLKNQKIFSHHSFQVWKILSVRSVLEMYNDFQDSLDTIFILRAKMILELCYQL